MIMYWYVLPDNATNILIVNTSEPVKASAKTTLAINHWEEIIELN